MMKSKLLASTLGLALIAGPALAQQADAPMRRDLPMQNGAMPMPAPATTGPGAERSGAERMGAGHMHRGMPHHAEGAAEEGRHQHRHGKMRSERAAARAENRMDAGELVQQASVALRAGRTAQARDLLEQSETRLLTRSTPADQAGQPMQGPVLDRLAAARAAIQARDRAGALREMDQALTGLRMARSDATSGAATMRDMPTQGGGPGWGSQTMRDGGSAGGSMSRADAIIRVQAGGSGSGGVAGSTPGSPGVGNPGSTPSTGMGTTTQPPQGSANPGRSTGSGAPGVGAPPPGSGTPQQGSGRGGLGGTTVQPGSPSGGGGTGGNPTR